jgi:hypothetical protein
MPRTTGLLHAAVFDGGLATSVSDAWQPKLPPYLWYEAGVLWAGQNAGQICPVGFDSQTAFKHCMQGNVLNPSFPQMAGPYAASFLVTTLKRGGMKYCLVAGGASMTGSTMAFCWQNGIKAPTPAFTSAIGTGVTASAYGPVYPAPLFTSVVAQSPDGSKTVSPKFILCSPAQASLALLGTCLFLAPDNLKEL